MPLDKIKKLLNEDSDYANKRMEKATQSSKRSSLDVIRLRADQKRKALASSGKRDLYRGRAIDEYGKPLQKQVKLLDGPTPEKPDLYGGMQPSDRASTSDDSKSQYDMKMLDLMQMIMSEKQDIANKLEQANQKNQELANKLKQVLREKEELAHQLKEVRLGEASSLQKGESGLQLINWEKITSWTKHYYVDKFAQTPAGEVWFDKYIDDWVFTRQDTDYMRKHAELLFRTNSGRRWFERKGVQWLESADGRACQKGHTSNEHPDLNAWYREKTGESLKWRY